MLTILSFVVGIVVVDFHLCVSYVGVVFGSSGSPKIFCASVVRQQLCRMWSCVEVVRRKILILIKLLTSCVF
jgi:hypothetical protein